jgi:hypothetical protein
MIVVKMQGGLGNQMFQYAAGRGLAARLGCRLFLDLSWFRRLPKGATPRVWELGRYPISAELLDPCDATSPWFWSMERLGCLWRTEGSWNWARSLREDARKFDDRLFSLKGKRVLEGYWQCPAYFESVADSLRQELSPMDAMGAEDASVAELIKSSGSRAVAVHVRRGDYLVGVHAAHHGVCDDDYYRTAFAWMRERLPSPQFFVFSDDPQWVASRPDLFEGAIQVLHNGPEQAFQDIRLMSMCSAHVIANSSFSWWGAWLSNGRSDLVVAPARWLADGSSVPRLLPSSWSRL